MSTNNNDTSNKTTSGRPNVSWDDVMQSRRLMVVQVKGTPFVERYIKSPWVAQRASVHVFRNNEQKEALLAIIPGDVALRAAGQMIRDGVVRSMEPVKKSWDMVVESVKDGAQLKLLGRCWEDVGQLGALTLAARMAGSAASILSRLGEEDDDGSD
ncbi:hypothetical protein EV181_000620 [Coemansia sp. RSA 532]|nr:hypothetical protein EV181_000620 [Coemansia sp. RSA 532]